MKDYVRRYLLELHKKLLSSSSETDFTNDAKILNEILKNYLFIPKNGVKSNMKVFLRNIKFGNILIIDNVKSISIMNGYTCITTMSLDHLAYDIDHWEILSIEHIFENKI